VSEKEGRDREKRSQRDTAYHARQRRMRKHSPDNEKCEHEPNGNRQYAEASRGGTRAGNRADEKEGRDGDEPAHR
jgi:hypothetical protein